MYVECNGPSSVTDQAIKQFPNLKEWSNTSSKHQESINKFRWVSCMAHLSRWKKAQPPFNTYKVCLNILIHKLQIYSWIISAENTSFMSSFLFNFVFCPLEFLSSSLNIPTQNNENSLCEIMNDTLKDSNKMEISHSSVTCCKFVLSKTDQFDWRGLQHLYIESVQHTYFFHLMDMSMSKGHSTDRLRVCINPSTCIHCQYFIWLCWETNKY